MSSKPTQIFTPTGGMNQDDSMLTPTPDYAGQNAFSQGDYKYALNCRIGSSRSDNFGDVEILKGTTEVVSDEEVDRYYVRGVTNINSDFSSGLDDWAQLSVTSGVAWVASAGSSVLDFPTAVVSNILYQAISPTFIGTGIGRRMGFRVKATISWLTETASIAIVFLNGSEIISTINIITDSNNINDPSSTDRVHDEYLNLDVPINCNAVGLQVYATPLSLPSQISIQDFIFYDWVSGERPSATSERVVGKYENKEFKQIFYAVYNSSGNYCIRCYDSQNNVILEILQWSGMLFEFYGFVSMAMIDNFLGFTDRVNPPRLIEIYSIGDLALYLGTDFREYHISFHKWAPVMPPILKAYYDGVTNNYLNFRGKSIQISHRYIFQNKLRSRWSPISVCGQTFNNLFEDEITHIQIIIPGFTYDNPSSSSDFNYFNNEDIKFTSIVDSIEIGFRENSEDTWKILQRYSVRSINNSIFSYNSSSNSTPIPTDDFYQLFDTVPFLAGAIEAIDNRFMFSDCLDEQPQAPPVQVTDVSVASDDAVTPGSWSIGYNNPTSNASEYTGMSSDDADEFGKRNYISQMTFKGRGIYKLGIQWIDRTGWRSGVYTSDTWTYDISEERIIVDKIYALQFYLPITFRPPEWAVAYQIMRTNCLNIDYFMFGLVNSFQAIIDDASQPTDNATVPQAIQDQVFGYFENARSVAGLALDQFRHVLKKKSFHQSMAGAVRKTSAASAISDASRVYINVNNWYNSSKHNSGGTQNNQLNNLYYNYRQGDRVRFVASTTASPIDSQKAVYDMPILDFFGRGIVVEKPSGILWLPGSTSNTDPADYMIEVYTPKDSNSRDYTYYECGELYPVLYPGTENRDMSKRDWTYTNNPGISCSTYGDVKVFNNKPISYGDCHVIRRSYFYDIQTNPAGSTSLTTYASSMNPDPQKTFDAWEQNDGRAAFAYSELPIAKFIGTKIRFGGQIVEQSFINQINRFRDEDQKVYPSEYGRIRSLVATANAQVESVGTILLAIGERETFSVYVNRVTLEDLSGNTQVALSDKVLGSYNTLLGSHGTMNPESVSVDRGRVYFWDALDGAWIRYGRDGLTEISEYKMRTWFNELGAYMLPGYNTDFPPLIISSFDSYNKELVTYMNHDYLPSTFRDYSVYKGSVFSEKDTRWKSVHSYEPERFANLNNQLISFKAGSLWLQERNDDRLTFYDDKKDAMIEPVFNEIPKVNSWQNIAVISSHKWSVDRFLSEYRGAKTKQQSSLTLAQFDEREDGYYAAIKMDQNTVNVTNPIVTGQKMRSKALRAMLKLDPSIITESLLYYVEVGEIDSPRNP